MNKTVLYAGVVLAMLFWSVTFVWVKQLLGAGMTPVSIIFFRLAITSCVMLPVALYSGLFKVISGKDFPLFLLLAFFEPFLYYIGEVNGINMVSPNIAAIIIATIPVFLPFIARFFIKEHLNLMNYLGILLSFIGVLIIVFNRDGSLYAHPQGLLYLFMAVAAAISYTIIAGKLLLKYSSFQLVSFKIIAGCLYFLPVFLYSDIHVIKSVVFTYKIIGMIVLLGLGGNFLAYFLYNRAIQKIGASKSAIFANLIPVFTIIFSFYIIQDSLPEYKFIGIALTLTGIYISQRKIKLDKTQNFRDK